MLPRTQKDTREVEVLTSMLVEDSASAEEMESLCNADDLFAARDNGYDCDGLDFAICISHLKYHVIQHGDFKVNIMSCL